MVLGLKKLKSRFPLKKLKKRYLPPHLFSKGGGGTQHLRPEIQCNWHFDDGKRCGKFAGRGKRYCSWHAGKSPDRYIDFDLLKEIRKSKIRLKGLSFNLEEYPQLVDIYKDRHPEIVVMKAAQCGVTEWAVQFALQFLRLHKRTTVIYTLPSRSLASSVSKLRIDSLYNDNQSAFMKQGHKGLYFAKYDSVYEKQIKDSFLYLQGTWTSTQTISTPGDVLIHDEVDFCKGDVLAKFRSRIGNSDYRIIKKFSTPTYPEYGIHKEFLNSDQHHWWYKCEHCGYIFKLCCAWPDVLFYNEKDNEPYFGCPKCKKEIKRNKGWWKPDNPGVLKRGYHVTKLAFPRAAAKLILEAKDEYKTDADFYNFELGLPFSGSEDQITKADIEACRDQRCALMVRDRHTCMGVDQGGSDLWVVVIRPKPNKLQLVYLEHITGPNCWAELGPIIAQFGVVRCIIDGLPNTIPAGQLQVAFPKTIYLAYYQERSFTDPINWQPAKKIVTIARHKTLDMVADKIRNRVLQLPITERLIDFEKHLASMVRVKVEDRTGESHYEWKRLKQDHYMHALNYAICASMKMDKRALEIYNPRAEANDRIMEGNYSDDIINHLATLLLEKLLTVESLYTYRSEKLNGKFVEDMSLSNKIKYVLRGLENRHTVSALIASLANIELVAQRVKIVEEKRLEELIAGGTEENGTGERKDECS